MDMEELVYNEGDGIMNMKHSVELKMPRIFGKKKVDEIEEKTEVKHSVELKMPEIFGKKNVDETEETETNRKKIMIIGGAVVAGFAMGYLIGHHNGANRPPQNVFVMK